MLFSPRPHQLNSPKTRQSNISKVTAIRQGKLRDNRVNCVIFLRKEHQSKPQQKKYASTLAAARAEYYRVLEDKCRKLILQQKMLNSTQPKDACVIDFTLFE